MGIVDPKQVVFVVEDDPGVRDSLSALLGAVGMRAVVFAHGDEILRCVPDMVEGCMLLDICLPDYDGFGLLQRLRAAGVRLPVIFMTGHEGYAREACRPDYGAYAVLRKPISDTLLLSTIGGAVRSVAVARC